MKLFASEKSTLAETYSKQLLKKGSKANLELTLMVYGSTESISTNSVIYKFIMEGKIKEEMEVYKYVLDNLANEFKRESFRKFVAITSLIEKKERKRGER